MRGKRRYRGAGLGIGLFLCLMPPAQATPQSAALSADEQAMRLLYGDELNVSIATGTAKPLHLAPSVASVITAREIREMGATRLDEALALAPGFHVGVSPYNRLNPNWSIRGIATN